MRIKIYQINIEKDKERVKFRAFNEIEKVNPEIYKNVYFGDVEVETLSEIYEMFNDNRPPTFQGHSLSVSDIVYIIDDIHKRYDNKSSFYCDKGYFRNIEFNTELAEDMSGMRVIYVTPGYTPLDIRILSDLKSMQNAVGGLIEPIYLDDNTVIICNEEAKLNGMKGNRRIGDGSSIIAGSFFVCGISGEEFTSLTDEQVRQYMKRFAEPEIISDEEVQTDTPYSSPPGSFIDHYYVVDDLRAAPLKVTEYQNRDDALSAYFELPADKLKAFGLMNTKELPGSLDFIQCIDGKDTFIEDYIKTDDPSWQNPEVDELVEYLKQQLDERSSVQQVNDL